MSFPKKVGVVAAAILLHVIVLDVAGVVASFFFDVAPVRGKSGALFYAIWFVLGVFAGMLSYNTAGKWVTPRSDKDWSEQEGAGRTGWLVVGVATVVLAGLSVLFYKTMWQGGAEASYFVPDSEPLTLTYFITILASLVFANTALRPKAR
ncbi:MAG: hypothetical protein ACHQ50_07775 [Fimbriimonadales bacterium]